MKVEYLVILNTNDSFCNSSKGIKSLLNAHEDIYI
ncbi:hypothetical protein UMC2_11371 [[Clostridium] sordellii]|nr:hypothetical protein UMC2_11371 [[Clostridium] sordellii] [Paeniclostridium sordellii]